MKKKVIAVAFADPHAANWKQFNKNGERLLIFQRSLEEILKASLHYGCPVLMAGDLIDHPKHVDNVVLQVLGSVLGKYRAEGKYLIGIEGNHDYFEKSSFRNQTIGYLTNLQKMGAPIMTLQFDHMDLTNFRVHGIPYINGNSDIKQALKDRIKNLSKKLPNILLIHTDLPGAIEADGREVGTADNIDREVKRMFRKFDLVLSGHIHRFQKIKSNLYMLGSTMQQRRSDAGISTGYCLIYNDMSVEHVPLNNPEFKFFDHGTTHEDTHDFWIEKPKPLIKTEEAEREFNFNVKANRSSLAIEYLKAKGIKSKSKLKLLQMYLND